MFNSFEDLYFEEITSIKQSYLDTDSFLNFKDQNQFKDESGMLIEAQLDDFISNQNDKPQNGHTSTFHNIIQEQKISFLPIQKKNYRYPRESKNYFKNIGPKLREFISQNFSNLTEIMNQTFILEFQMIQNQNHTKFHIQRLCKSRLGKAIAKIFFKNYRWVKSLVNDDLRSYFRLNSDWNN
ncbi:unnamed protein product [Paramecium sonneborni]|uniref:Uncharacterized protein n=1 Tax=Paramecium sonneborni TaxID=65129 RepID=A0A8S1PRR0_9CILI|nr:unnamed protein product [Paramecium sonneborni]